MAFNLNDVTAEEFRLIWDNHGRLGPNKGDATVKCEDALSVPNAPNFFSKTISNIVREAVEPLLAVTPLLQRVNFTGYGQTITFGAVGALYAADIPEYGEYPERSMNTGPGTVTANIGKVGIAVKITEEMVRYSQYDIMGMHLRACGRALARHKEMKVFNMIRSLGTCVFNNLEPTKSLNGVCTGRDLQGSPNGACTMDDIFDAYAQCMSQGFRPDTILMHPLSWIMWVKDAQLRAFVQANGAGVMFANVQNAAQQVGWPGGMNGPGAGQNIVPGQTATGVTSPSGLSPSGLLAYPQNLTTAPTLPSYLGIPFVIIVSPWVPYDSSRKLTDIYMFDRNELGVLIVDEEVTTDQFADPARDLLKLKMRERYGMAMLDEGHGVVTLKNVHVVPNEIVLPAQSTIDVSGNLLAKIAPDASISL